MASGVIVDPDEGTFFEYWDQAMNDFSVHGIVDMRAIISDKNAIAISWVFGIAEELVRRKNGRIIQCDAAAYETGFREMRLILDKSRDPIILPSITPAEHFRVIVHPLACRQPYGSYSYLLECQEAFHSHRVFGITGMGTNDQPEGIDYCIRIADELKRSEDAIVIVSSGWIFGSRQYALDIVLIHRNTARAELVPGWSRNWNFHSRCKLQRWPLPPWLQ